MGLDIGELGNIFQRTGKLATGFDDLFEKGGSKMDEDEMSRENYAFGRLNGSGANEYAPYKNTPVGFVTQNSAANSNSTMYIIGGFALVIIVFLIARK